MHLLVPFITENFLKISNSYPHYLKQFIELFQS